jgi:hypothetical protein
MSLFCLLWIPLFCLFRRSIADESGAGGVWALLLGSVTAVFQFFFGSLMDPGGFGFSRWLSGFVDIVSLPVLLPLAVYALLVLLGALSGGPDITNFIMLWLIPVAALRAVSWSPLNDPLLLVFVPLLWTSLAEGISFLIKCVMGCTSRFAVIMIIGIAALPIAAATAYWALFSQRPLVGYPLFFAVMLPMLVSVTLDITGA